MLVQVNSQDVFVGTGTSKHQPGARTVVFVHGAGMDHTVWTLPARYFARNGFNVAAVDLPGHGRSKGRPFTQIEEMSAWLHEVNMQLDFERSCVIGHSMGSLVAMQYALDHPNDVTGIALLGTSAPMPVTEQLLTAAKENSHAAYVMANTWSHSTHGKIGGNATPGVWMMGIGDRLLHRSRESVFHSDLVACNSFTANVSRISCPKLLILGESDQMTPMRAGLTVGESDSPVVHPSQLPRTRDSQTVVVQLADCGHAMLNENPNEILDALSWFVHSCPDKDARQ